MERERRSREYWEHELSEYWDSGLTVQEYSELKELPYESVRRWIRRLKQERPGDLQSQWRQLPSMAGRHFDPHQYHASITDRLFAPSKLGSSTHVEISRESHANAPLSDFNGNPSSLAGQRRKIRPDAFKGKKTRPKILLS